MSRRREVRQQVRQLLLQIRRMENVAVAYHCACGQHLILTNFEPSLLRRETVGIDVVVLKTFDRVACPQCGAALAPVWQAAERVWAEDTLARLESLGVEGQVQALRVALRGLQEARLQLN
jgi:hypothetical protein